MWETTVMHKEVSGWTVNFDPNFPESPFLELKTRKPPTPPPILENFRFRMTKVYSEIPPPPFRKTSDLGWPKFTLEYPTPHPPWKLSESPSPRVSECGELLHVETLSNPDNCSLVLSILGFGGRSWYNISHKLVLSVWVKTCFEQRSTYT